MLEFKTIEDTGDESKVVALVYGLPGVGKTAFGLASARRVCLATCEWEQMQLTYRTIHKLGLMNKDSRIVPIKSPKDLKELHEYILLNPDAFDVLVLDHISGFQDIIKEALLSKKNNEDKGKLDSLNIGEQGMLIDKTLALVKLFRDLPKIHLVVLAHYEETWSSEQQRHIKPALIGKKLPYRISGVLNLVGYMQMTVQGKEIDRFITFIANERTLTKMHPNLRVTEPADLDFILAKVEGKIATEVEFDEYKHKEVIDTQASEPVETPNLTTPNLTTPSTKEPTLKKGKK
jgi:hypothetical protein